MHYIPLWGIFIVGPFFLATFFPWIIGYGFFISIILNIYLGYKLLKGENDVR